SAGYSGIRQGRTACRTRVVAVVHGPSLRCPGGCSSAPSCAPTCTTLWAGPDLHNPAVAPPIRRDQDLWRTHAMKIVVAGGDGFCGWPTALYLSQKGHDVTIVDNLVRRDIDEELGSNSVTPILPLEERVAAWKEVSGRDIAVRIADLTDYDEVAAVFRAVQPEAFVHFAEHRSAPYSMIDREHAIENHRNNIEGTLNVLWAIKDFAPDCHLVKLGTMGEYGQPNIDIEEGWLEVEHKGRKDRLPYPKQPGSFYHLTKVHDS